MTLAIPQEWQDVLKQVQEVFPSAIIAGGALRDLMHGKPIKDVDIFIPVHLDYCGNLGIVYEAMWNTFAGENIIVDPDSQYGVHNPEEAGRDLYAIFKLDRTYKTVVHSEFHTSYDLILCTPEAANITTFDINICQITYDGKITRFTGAYAHGFLTRTLKVMNINRTDRNQKRIERMLDKYPNFKVEQTDER